MKKIYPLVFLGIVFLVISCQNTFTSSEVCDNQDNLLLATLYHQRAAEMAALSHQAYNIAQFQLERIADTATDLSRLTIVLDLDETVLDNSAYEARCVLENVSYPDGWDEWMFAADALALPGAVEFLEYAQAKGISIFYITNRREKYRDATIQNLRKLNIPLASENHILLRTDESSKKERRDLVSKENEIVMLFGDNLADFSDVFDGENTPGHRDALVDSLKTAFGERYIVFPNAMYGDWLNALIEYDFSLSNTEKVRKMKEQLIAF
jgi:5'-nucleotidase (lipoprotein e(P4) family)